MSKKYSLIVTEGSHDQAAVGKILHMLGLKKFNGKREELDPFWGNLIPKAYPIKEDFYKPMNMPHIYSSAIHSVAIHHGEGKEDIPKEVVGAYISYEQALYAIGIVIDSDNKNASDAIKECKQRLEKEAKGVELILPEFPNIPGIDILQLPRTGIYVLPSSERMGTLDTVLMDCAAISYPKYKQKAEQFLDDIIQSIDDPHTRKLRRAITEKQKVLVSIIVSVLKPGRANTPSITDNEWICENTESKVPEIALLKRFTLELLALS